MTGKCDWAYSDIVKDHFLNPRNFVRDEKEVAAADGVGMMGAPACGDVMKMWIWVKDGKITECKWQTFGCFPAGQLVYSPLGLLPIELFKIGDPVFAGDGKTWHIVGPNRREYKGRMLTITPLISRINAISVTPEHPIYCVQRKNLKGTGPQAHTRFFKVNPKIFASAKADYVCAKDLKVGDYLIYRYPQEEKDVIELTEDMMKLLGYYLSEGYFSSNDKNGEYGTLAFAFHKDEHDLIEDVITLLKRIFHKEARQRTRGNVTEVYICSRKAIRLMQRYCGHYAREKRLCPEILLLPIAKQKILFNSYLKGDGHVHHDKRGNRADTVVLSTASLHLTYQLQLIIARLGYFAKIRSRMPTPSAIDGRSIRNMIQYTVTYVTNPSFKSVIKGGKGVFYVPIGKITEECYEGDVFNLEVDSQNPSYLANGFVVHNCASAIASTSMLSEMAKGLRIEEALQITPKQIAERLGGLPSIKIHCSVLGDQALRAAIEDYKTKVGKSGKAK